MLEKLQSNNVSIDCIEQDLTYIIEADADEIDGIVKTLRELRMSVEENIVLIAYVSSDRLKEIVKILQENGVNNDEIAKELKSIVLEEKRGQTPIEDVFNDEQDQQDKKRYFRNIKKYIRLTGRYGTYYTKEEMEELCARKHISPEEFIREIMNVKDDFVKIYYDKIISGGKLYIGPTKAIDNKYLEEYSELILELSAMTSRRFARNIVGYHLEELQSIVGYDLEELQGIALELIVNQCGGLVDNLKENEDALRGAIINRITKCLYGTIQPQTLSITQTYTSRSGITFTSENEIAQDINENFYESSDENTLKETINYELADFSDEEEEIMECMISLIEDGEADELYKKVAQIVFMKEEEVLTHIHSIRAKMIQNKLVKKHEMGGYEFNKNNEVNTADITKQHERLDK